jgi:large subunit ribosomal protein L11
MAKKVTRIATLQFQAGQAKPGPELAGLGIDMGGFTKDYNDATREKAGMVVPVIITAYDDRSYDFKLKSTPAPNMIREAAGVAKGAQKPSREIVGSVTIDQLREIAEYKMNDLNAGTLDAAISMLKGTARNMGIEVKEAGASNKEEGDN